MQSPLVSIVICNENQGPLLAACIDSVLQQTYRNIEILIADNASTDPSWDIACDYAKRYPDRFFLLRNHKNTDQNANLRSCLSQLRGKYFLIMEAHSHLASDCIARAVAPLEAYPDACMTLMDGYTLDDQEVKSPELPLYLHACKIPPGQHSGLYLLAESSPQISHIVYRTTHYIATAELEGAGGHGNRMLGHRVLDFTLSCLYATIYLNQPLVGHRARTQQAHSARAEKLEAVITTYFLNFEFCDIANHFGYGHVSEGWNTALTHLARLTLKYAAESFLAGDQPLSKRFYYLAAALWPEIDREETFQKLSKYWRQPCPVDTLVLSLQAYCNSLQKPTFLEPPTGSLPLLTH